MTFTKQEAQLIKKAIRRQKRITSFFIKKFPNLNSFNKARLNKEFEMTLSITEKITEGKS